MQPEIKLPESEPPIDRGYAVSMVIKAFKGHVNVEVHLFRSSWDPQEPELYDWQEILGGAISEDRPTDTEKAKKVLLETFSSRENRQLVDYLRDRYGSRLASITSQVVEFPVPLDLEPLSEIRETESVGILELDRIPNYPLDFQVRGIYDLSRHESL